MTWNVVKLIAIVAMTIDHATTLPIQMFLLDHFDIPLSVTFPIIQMMHLIGRIAFPIFAYGVAQGCMYTKNQKKYLLRLLVFALLSEIPFSLALQQSVRFGMTNVIFTLLLGALGCVAWKSFRERKKQGRPYLSLLFSRFWLKLLIQITAEWAFCASCFPTFVCRTKSGVCCVWQD